MRRAWAILLIVVASGCKHRAACRALLDAVDRGDSAAVASAVASGAGTECTDSQGHTPLHLAAISDDEGSARALVDHGANKEALDREQRTPLCECAKNGGAKVAELLLAHGANVEGHCRGIEFTALHIAAGADAVDVMKVLLTHGAKVNARNVYKQTPLHQAAMEAASGLTVSKLLVEHGIELEIHDKDGFTPLIAASESGKQPLVEFLVEHGANVGAATNSGFTAIDYAKKHRHSATVAFLAAHGGKLHEAAPAASARME